MAALLLPLSTSASDASAPSAPPGGDRQPVQAAELEEVSVTASRLNLELHRLPGFWASAVLAAVLVSGVCMNLHEPFVWLVRRFSPGSEAPRPTTSVPAAGRAPLTPEQVLARAQAAHPGGWHDVTAPVGPTGVYGVTFYGVPSTSWFWAERVLILDAYTGEVLDVRDATTRHTRGDAFLDWQWPLHSGKAFGWPGRIAVFIAGLACPLLFVTGVIRWSRRPGSARRSRASPDPSGPQQLRAR